MPGSTGATRLHILDVRPILAGGAHPLTEVLALAEGLDAAGVLEVVAPFAAGPLVRLLRERGLHVEVSGPPGAPGTGANACSQVQACPPPLTGTEGTWVLRISPSPLPALEELTQLEAPLPLERVLEACAALAPGAVYLAHLPRFPALLVPHLERRALEWQSAGRPDGSVVLWVRGGAR